MDNDEDNKNDYDPEGGHTRAEAEVAYAELFKELHNEEPDGILESAEYSISTRMACEYLRRGVIPDPETARRLCMDIISDTEMFRAKGTTRADRLAAAALANIAGVDIEKLAMEMELDWDNDVEEI